MLESNFTLSLFLIIFLLPLNLSSNFKVNPKANSFIDQYGRNRIFHSVNAVYKLPPYHPPILDHFHPNNSLAEKDFQDLRRWGFTAIRLYMSWEGAEKTRGKYNMTYLDTVRDITRAAAKHGISIILDAHQDIASRKFCGEGFPGWAVNRTDFPYPLIVDMSFDEDGNAELKDCLQRPFFIHGLSNDPQRAFTALFEDTDGIGTSFAYFWATVAKHFKDEPNLIGYELINEPCPGAKNSLFDPQGQDREFLAPFYKKVHEKIREVDDQTIILFEATTTTLTSIGLTEGPGGPEYNDRQAYAYHIYCPFVNPNGEPYFDILCLIFDYVILNIKAWYPKKFGIAGFMTEFGALEGGEASVHEIARVLMLADMNLDSWAYWQYKYFDDFTTAADPGYVEGFYNPEGKLYEGKVKALARSYVYATCGVPVFLNFNPRDADFRYTYTYQKDCGGMGTEVFLSEEYYYPNGFKVRFFGCDGCTLEKLRDEPNYYVIKVPNGVNEGTNITLHVRPTSA